VRVCLDRLEERKQAADAHLVTAPEAHSGGLCLGHCVVARRATGMPRLE
jgi:hypothetical protein